MSLDPRFVLMGDLQQYFVDKTTGLPLSNGKVYTWADESRLTPKPLYTLTGSYGNYSFVALQNPVILSDVGTFSDGANDIVPYYFVYEGVPQQMSTTPQLYYIEVFNEDDERQFTRQAWPNFLGDGSSVSNSTITNYIPNGQFKIHTDVPGNPATGIPTGRITTANTNIAEGNWTYERENGDTSTALDNIIFFRNTTQIPSPPSQNPRYYLNAVCNQVGNEDFKNICITFNDVNKFTSNTFQFTFSLTIFSDSGNVSIPVYAVQNFGTDGSTTIETQIGTLPVTSAPQQLFLSFNIPTQSGAVGPIDDDYIKFQLRLPTNSTFDIKMTDVILTPGNLTVAPTFPITTDWQFLKSASFGGMPLPNPNGMDLYLPINWTQSGFNYDDSDIGKVYAAMYYIPQTGELSCDGTSYKIDSYSDDGIPYQRIANRLFYAPNNSYQFGTGFQFVNTYTGTTTTNNIYIMNNSAGVVTPIAQGTLSTTMAMTNIASGGTYGFSGYYYRAINSALIEVNLAGVPFGTNGNGTAGATVTVTSTRIGTSLLKAILNVEVIGAPVGGQYFQICNTTTQYFVWWTVDGGGSAPSPGGTGIRLDLLSTMSLIDIAKIIAGALSGFYESKIVGIAAGSIPAGSWFSFFANSQKYVPWYKKDGIGSQPVGVTGDPIFIEIDIVTGQTSAQVATASQLALNMTYVGTPFMNGLFIRGWDDNAGIDPDAAERFSQQSMDNNGDAIGTLEYNEIWSHFHTQNSFAEVDRGGTGSPTNEVNSTTPTSSTGGKESRPVNMTVNWVIKY